MNTNTFLLKFVFCRDCLQGYHIDECQTNGDGSMPSMMMNTDYVVDAQRAAQVSSSVCPIGM